MDRENNKVMVKLLTHGKMIIGEFHSGTKKQSSIQQLHRNLLKYTR